MVFISNNKFRKCKYCDNEVKKHITKNGINKGYYKTCSSKKCTSEQYRDATVCRQKGRRKIDIYIICVICNSNFKSQSSNHIKYCKICVPSAAWRGRALRYGIGKPQWDFLLEKQNYKCLLCDKNPEVVDHCHKKRTVRGLLCNSCNVQISKIDMDISWLQRALKYLGIKYVPI